MQGEAGTPLQVLVTETEPRPRVRERGASLGRGASAPTLPGRLGHSLLGRGGQEGPRALLGIKVGLCCLGLFFCLSSSGSWNHWMLDPLEVRPWGFCAFRVRQGRPQAQAPKRASERRHWTPGQRDGDPLGQGTGCPGQGKPLRVIKQGEGTPCALGSVRPADPTTLPLAGGDRARTRNL